MAALSTVPARLAFRGDVCVRGDRIAELGWLDNRTARRRVDATGFVAAPGFIDLLGQSEFMIFLDNRAASKITQGITTEITGEGSLGSAAHRDARRLTSRKVYYDTHVAVGDDLVGVFGGLGEGRFQIHEDAQDSRLVARLQRTNGSTERLPETRHVRFSAPTGLPTRTGFFSL